MKINGKIIERVQDMYMRVAIGIFDNCIDDVVEAYNLLSNKHFIFATPTLFNAGTNNSQLLSCFLLGIHDSIAGIYKNIRDCALISKDSGGIGIHIQEIRGKWRVYSRFKW